ncbi:MAG: hypothetical protein E7445_01525 [Ruminococcaceae bacterium]|nr:hypothetical protein [Oscillospiraceae bacterium]
MRNLFCQEPGFYKRLFLLALPMVLQNLITTSLGFADTFMVGLVGSRKCINNVTVIGKQLCFSIARKTIC